MCIRDSQIVEKYVTGERVSVYVDPSNPENSLLEPGITLGSFTRVSCVSLLLVPVLLGFVAIS